MFDTYFIEIVVGKEKVLHKTRKWADIQPALIKFAENFPAMHVFVSAEKNVAFFVNFEFAFGKLISAEIM